MKTVTPKEQQLLKRMLKKYYDHIMRNTGTLIVRFLGLHCLRVRKTHSHAGRLIHRDRKLHFVVMGNMFNTPFEIHCRYDLKGSWVGRVTHERHTLDPSIALKDVDFKQDEQRIRVGKELKDQLIKQIESDSAFLRDNNVIDYSLLLGIHTIGQKKSEDEEETDDDKAIHIKEAPSLQHATSLPLGQGSRNFADMARTSSQASQATGSYMSNAMLVQKQGSDEASEQYDWMGLLSSDRRQRYFFGIIDILTPYDSRKRFEHHFKAMRYDRRGVSCCPPVFYAERFNDFMDRAFE
jgi:1-phosphatidylinositol-4-phosphate 5-kinase